MEKPKILGWDDDFTFRKKYGLYYDQLPDSIVKYRDEYIPLKSLFKENDNIEELWEFVSENYRYVKRRLFAMEYVEYLGLDNIDEKSLETVSMVDDRDYYKVEDLSPVFNSWKEESNKQKELIASDVELINDIHKKLSKYKDPYKRNITTSSPIMEKITLSCELSNKDKIAINIKDGIDIFDNSIVSMRVPYIRYTSDRKSYYKLFSGINNYKLIDSILREKTSHKLGKEKIIKMIKETKKYTMSQISAMSLDKLRTTFEELGLGSDIVEETKDVNFIDMILWLQSSGDVDNSSVKFFTKARYNISKNIFRVIIPLDESSISLDAVIDLIKSSLPSVIMTKSTQKDIKSKFNVFAFKGDDVTDISFDSIIFNDIMTQGLRLIGTDDERGLIGAYLFNNEFDKPSLMKISNRINFRSLTSGYDDMEQLVKNLPVSTFSNKISNIIFSIKNKKTSSGESFTISENIEETVMMPKGLNYATVKIKKGSTLDDINLFIKLIKIFTTIYLNNKSKTLKLYRSLFDISLLDEEIKIEDKKTLLKNIDSDIFVSGYPKLCQDSPIVVNEEDREEWEKKGRRVMDFPKDNPRLLFTCPDDKYPHVCVKENNLENADKYPYVPCCFKTDLLNEKRDNTCKRYLQGTGRAYERGAKTNEIVKGRQYIGQNRFAFIPIILNDAFKLYNKDSGFFLRQGAQKSPNSVIHSILIGIGDRDYLFVENKNKYILNERRKLLNFMVVCGQELYDKNYQQISDIIDDESIFLDPVLFYRGLQELYNINIYIFCPDGIVVPRHQYFHIHEERKNVKTVLIYRHMGVEINKLTDPQCELILERRKDVDVTHFGEDMNSICYQILLHSSGTLTWSFSKKEGLVGNDDIYTILDYEKIIPKGYKPFEQYIDGSGKMRALNIQKGEETISMVLLPGAPLNLPIMESVHRTTLHRAVEIFGTPRSFDVVTEGQKTVIRGLWFSKEGMDDVLYIRIKKTKTTKNIGENSLLYIKDTKPIEFAVKGNGNPLSTSLFNSESERYSKLKRDINIIVSLTQWFYEIYMLIKNDGDIYSFVEEYFAVDSNTIDDSLNYYNFDEIPYKLPIYKKLSDAFSYVERKNTNFVRLPKSLGGKVYKIFFYNENFWKKMVEYMYQYERKRKNAGVSRYISNYYQYNKDFRKSDDSFVLVGSREYKKWFNSIVSAKTDTYLIHRSIDKNKYLSNSPYVFAFTKINDDRETYYIIQNVFNGDIYRSLNCSYMWEKTTVNPGYNTKPLDVNLFDKTRYILYSISSSGSLEIKDDRSNGKGSIEILEYNVPNYRLTYAAMLRLN